MVVDGKIRDGKHQKFRCFSASMEVSRPNILRARQHNLDILKGAGGGKTAAMARIIAEDLPGVARFVRIHVGGDFFSQAYFDAWLKVAGERPHVKFYAYTKSLDFWVARLDVIPPNMVLTASRGGTKDHLIDQHKLKEAIVVFSEEEAAALSLEIDDNELMAMDDSVRKAALKIHGQQRKGSAAADALRELKVKKGFTGYSKQANRKDATLIGVVKGEGQSVKEVA